MPMVGAGSASVRNDGRARGGIRRRQTRSRRRRGRPRPGEACARARQRGTPGRFAAPTAPPLGGRRSGLDARKVGSPSRRRGNGVDSRRVRGRGSLGAAPGWTRPPKASGARAANARRGGRAHRPRPPPGEARHVGRCTPGATRRRSPRTVREDGPGAAALRPPAGSRRVRRSQVLSISTSRRAPRLRGRTARRAAPPRGATRAGGRSDLDEVSTAAARGRSSRVTPEGLSLAERSRGRSPGTRGHGGRPLTGASVRGSTSPLEKGLAPESAGSHGRPSSEGRRLERVRGSPGSRAGSPSLVTRRGAPERPLTARRCSSCRTQVPGPKSPE